MNNNKQNVVAIYRNIRISPTKIEKIVSKIRGKTYREALEIIKFLPQKSGAIVWQTLYSAVSNATNNFELEKSKLFISEAFVNQGSIAKRVACGSKGSPRRIEKKSSHLTIKVIEKEN